MTHYDPNRPDPRHPDPAFRRPHDLTDPADPFERTTEGPALTASEARQAPPGRPVLYVLIASLALALLAWAAVELYPRDGAQTAENGAGQPAITGTTPERAPTAGGVPRSPPPGSPEAAPTPTSPSPPSPASDSAR